MSDEIRNDEDLQARIEASRRNLTPSAVPEGDPPEDYRELVREYPFALMAGGLALGAVIGALLPRGIAGKLARNALSAAVIAGEISLNYGQQAAQQAGEASREGREKLSVLGKNAEVKGRKALSAAGAAAGTSSRMGRDLGIRVARQAIRFVSDLRH